MYTYSSKLQSAILALVLAGCQFVAVHANSQERAGRSITILTAGTPGGGYDAYARLLSRHLGRHLSGSPVIVVKNVPGGGGLTLASNLYNVEPKDGSSFGIFPNTIAFAPLLGDAKYNFDPQKFSWLGSLDKFVPIVLAWHTTNFHSFEDIKKVELSVGSTGVGSSSYINPVFLNAFFGTKFKVVNGYPGSAEITLAIERRELDGYSAWCWTCLQSQKPDWLSDRKVRILLQLDYQGEPELNKMGVPTLDRILETDLQRKLSAVVFGGAALSRPFAAPPGVPTGPLRALRNGIAAAAGDPAMIAEAKKTGNRILFTDADEIDKVLAEAFSTPPEMLRDLKLALGVH